MTTLETKNNRSWTEQEAKDFINEVERLKELWFPGPEVSTREALINLANDAPKANHSVERMNAERREENEQRKQERLRKIKGENKNLEWPRPKLSEHLKIRKSSDYWKDNGGCPYNCGYKPKTTHDYEVHIVTSHPGKPGYPGPPDLEKYGLLYHHKNRSNGNFAGVADENEPSSSESENNLANQYPSNGMV